MIYFCTLNIELRDQILDRVRYCLKNFAFSVDVILEFWCYLFSRKTVEVRSKLAFIQWPLYNGSLHGLESQATLGCIQNFMVEDIMGHFKR